MRRASFRLVGSAVGIALLATACSSPAPLTPLRVRLPLQEAGVTDLRQAVAPLMGLSQADLTQWFEGSAGDGGTELARAHRERALQRAPRTVVLMVPGLLGDCVSHQAAPFGDGRPREEGDDSTPYGAYADLGLLRMELLPLPGRQGVASNGRRVADRVAYWAAQPGVERLVLVGYSKGVPDALEGLSHLQASGRWPSKPVALVSMAGAVMGSPLADRLADTVQAWQPQGAVGACGPADANALQELRSDVRAAWWATAQLPGSLRRYSVVAQADPSHTAPLLRPLHDWLSQIDPRNDGQLLVSDAVLPGSSLLALARTGHWGLALPLERHPSAWVRLASASPGFPREALLRGVLLWVLGEP